ncbi:MAG TPA: class II glutamine amidotransferase [Acidimicrobiales bacterium]|nr:class II glutamine amidotransferase [Acidimicrobiales bacterium]
MCRLIGFVSPSPQSLRDVLGDERYDSFEQFSCAEHGDGWGMAWCDGSVIRSEKEPVPAATSVRYKELVNESFDAAFVHYRWATLSLAVRPGNTHPFTSGEIAFSHNGSISDVTHLDEFIAPEQLQHLEGNTDSERYFRLLLSSMSNGDVEEGLRKAVATIVEHQTYSSLNALVLTPDALFAVCYFSNSPLPPELPDDYYEMGVFSANGATVVASSGWQHGEWSPLGNGNMLRIDRATGAATVTAVLEIDRP